MILDRSLRAGLGAALVAVLLLSACGSSGYTYAGSSQLHVVFRVPGDWTVYPARDLAQAVGNVQDQSFAKQYPFLIGFDSSPQPNLERVVDPARISQYPAVMSYVHALGPGERDAVSLKSLRNIRYPVDQLESEGAGSTISYSSFGLTGGFWGNKLTFVIRSSPTSPALEFSQVAAVDAKLQYEYVLVVACSPDCFVRSHGAITDILNSWRLK